MAEGARRARRWEDLGDDCLVKIFRQLWVKDLVVAVPLVCKSWRRVSLRPDCWCSLNLSVLQFKFNAFVKILVRRGSMVKFHQRRALMPFSDLLRFLVNRSDGYMVEFIFPDHRVWSVDLTFLSDRCSGLKVLGLPMFGRNEGGCILENASKWKNLEYLYMRHKPGHFTEIVKEISVHCKKLVGLQACGKFDYEEMAAIPTFLPKLKYLCLKGSRVSKEGLITILKGCRELEEFHVEDCFSVEVDDGELHLIEVDDEVLQSAAHIKSFKYDESALDTPKVSSDWERFEGYLWCGNNNDIRFHRLI